MNSLVTRRLRVHGIVQGVGFRPTVARHAARAGIRGSVCNKGPYVEIVAQGTPTQVEGFTRLLKDEPPRRADVVRTEVIDVPAGEAPVYQRFSIIESARTRGAIFVSPDIAICDDCKRELFDPTDRRYLHPFINCTCCGPRLTILDTLPYDRERTSMRDFPMCPDCAREYHDPTSRRYDAQPVCCNECGPEVYLMGRPERGHEAISAARRAIADGGIVAVKGIGGFHLCCDATSEDAVSLLRARKHRPQKPFAVMMRDEGVARRECVVDAAQEEVLTGHQKPIVLLRRRDGGLIAPSVAPGNPRVGVMLPYAPIQLLLFTYDDGVGMPDCLVMTSGNVSGAPICRDDDDVRSQLSGMCDVVLSNDRPILTRADDSVMDFFGGEPYMVRRSRGYAPLPVALSRDLGAQVLAVGGELKNTFCLGHDDLFYPSAYVGDLADLRTVRALEEGVARMETLLEVRPQAVACDLHPRYNSVAVARRLAEEADVPLVPVQHHYAHVVSCMAENDREAPVLGVSFDGTGYGTDGTIWGGELLACDWHGFRRVGSIKPFRQVGGDRSSREGWRVAVSMVNNLCGDRDRTLQLVERLGLCDARCARAQVVMADRGLNAVTSTSVGRLFDAASAVLGIRLASTFEGEASMALQFAAERFAETSSPERLHQAEVLVHGCRCSRDGAGFVTLGTDGLFRAIAEARLAGGDPDELAYAFHVGLARLVCDATAGAARAEGLDTAALSGGCFQNTLLLGLTKQYLEAQGLTVLTHHLVPPNDGGIALGQAVVAAQALRDGRISTNNTQAKES